MRYTPKISQCIRGHKHWIHQSQNYIQDNSLIQINKL